MAIISNNMLQFLLLLTTCILSLTICFYKWHGAFNGPINMTLRCKVTDRAIFSKGTLSNMDEIQGHVCSRPYALPRDPRQTHISICIKPVNFPWSELPPAYLMSAIPGDVLNMVKSALSFYRRLDWGDRISTTLQPRAHSVLYTVASVVLYDLRLSI